MSAHPSDLTHERIAVVGAGSWGTALANLLAVKGYGVDLWTYESEVCDQIRNTKENQIYLPDIALSDNVQPDTDLQRVVENQKVVLIVVPSHVLRETAARLQSILNPQAIVITASKGIENQTHLTMSGVLLDSLPAITRQQVAVLSGPSFAREVARLVPTVVTVAAYNMDVAQQVQQVFATPFFRVYTNDDVLGVELGGAVKNVIAIAAGMVDGMGLGLNTRAALITRGLAEIRRLGLQLGANPRTFTGLAGVGDLILTCTGTLSRNHTVGLQLGQGQTLEQILAGMRMVAEGVKTARSVYNLSCKVGVEMPISHAVYRILYEGEKPPVALHRLMTRTLRAELDEE